MRIRKCWLEPATCRLAERSGKPDLASAIKTLMEGGAVTERVQALGVLYDLGYLGQFASRAIQAEAAKGEAAEPKTVQPRLELLSAWSRNYPDDATLICRLLFDDLFLMQRGKIPADGEPKGASELTVSHVRVLKGMGDSARELAGRLQKSIDDQLESGTLTEGAKEAFRRYRREVTEPILKP